ncbi:hypothetical protein Tco_1039531 [Tanacetum coccineum]
MDPNSSFGKICLGEDVVVILSDKVEGSEDWNSPEFQDIANSREKKETKAIVFYQMETKEVSDRFVAPCFINGLEAYDGEINLGVEENMISNEYAFIINPEEDDVEPGVIFRRSFLRMTKAITDFEAGTITIYPDIDPFLEDIEEEEKSKEELLPFVCKMGKSSHNKKRAMENLNFFYQDIGTSSSAGGHLTQEEAAKEALAIRMSQKFALLEEERPIIETMAYHDKYKKILDEVWKDKVELDGKIVKEEEEAVKKIKGEALKEKDKPGAFIFPIRLEGQLGREDMKKVDRGITTINHTQAEAMRILTNVLCQVGITALIAKFLILDIPIDRDSPIVVGRGFLRTIGDIVNTPERLFSINMDPNSSLGKICLGEDVVVISSDKVEGSGDWNSPKFQDTANSGQKKETKAMVFHQMETEEVSNRFVAPCFVNGLEVYDGEINLGVVKKELIVALRWEIYFMKFIINLEEDDVEPGVIFSRSFLRMTKSITDFGAGTIIIYPDIDPFLKETEEQEKSNDDWDNLLDFNLDDAPLLGIEYQENDKNKVKTDKTGHGNGKSIRN